MVSVLSLKQKFQVCVTGTRVLSSKGKDEHRTTDGVVHLPLQMKFHVEDSLVNRKKLASINVAIVRIVSIK